MSAQSEQKKPDKPDKEKPTFEDSFTTPTPHHISDVDTWGHADRNFFVFVALTFLFGFFGLDHMYLRSNTTGFQKLLMNIGGLGIWYFWDIIQVLKDGKLVRKHGLNSPFDWIRGIGRGMFKPLPVDLSKEEARQQKEGPQFAAPKSYFLYTLLAIGLGALGADKFYLGHTWQGVAKVFSVFNIFLFLFGIAWVVWDAVHAYFMTPTLLKEGVAAPLPFSWFFKPIDAQLFKVVEVKEEPEDKRSFLEKLPIPSLPLREAYRELIVPILQPTVGTAIQSTAKIASVGTKAAGLGLSALTAGPALVSGLTSQIAEQVDAVTQEAQSKLPLGTTVAAVQDAAAKAYENRSQPQFPTQQAPQTGGGSVGGPGPVLAGAFTALLVAGGLKGAYDFMAKTI